MRGDQIAQERCRARTLTTIAGPRFALNPRLRTENLADSKHPHHDPHDVLRAVSQQIQVRRFYAVTFYRERHGISHRAYGNAVVPIGAQLLPEHTTDAHAKD